MTSNAVPIYKPLFIIGMPRSGTTVFYRALARHTHLAWFSPATRKFPCHPTWSRLNALIRNDQLPVEASRIWSRFARHKDDTLDAQHATSEAHAYYTQALSTPLTLMNRPRFLCKHPRNSLRISFFDALFPDAYFIHLIRDGRAVAESILRKRRHAGDEYAWWDVRPPGWHDQLAREPMEQIGWQWATTISMLRESARALPHAEKRCIEIRYEDFCLDPEKNLTQVARFCDLPEIKSAWSHLPDIASQNDKWRSTLTEKEQTDFARAVNEIMPNSLV